MWACGWCTTGGAAGYMIGGLALTIAGLVVTAVIGAAVAVLRSVLLNNSDPRSPFVRFMLIICVLMGRAPGDYLPPTPDDRLQTRTARRARGGAARARGRITSRQRTSTRSRRDCPAVRGPFPPIMAEIPYPPLRVVAAD
jgi:hypothetical protein